VFALLRKSRKYAAVDLDRRHLRVVKFACTSNGSRIDALQSAVVPAELDFNSAEEVGQLLAEILRTMRLSGCSVVLNVPRSQAMLNTMSLPAGTPAGELAGMVHYQIAKDLPFAPMEAVIDFSVESQLAGEGISVLAAAVRLPVVDFYRRLAEVAKVRTAKEWAM